MIFRVINEDGQCVMSTTHESCIPEEEQLRDMYKSGYKFKLNNKLVNVKNIKEYRLAYVQ